MNSALADTVKKVSAALGLSNVTEKTERLLALREENNILLVEALRQRKPTVTDRVYRLGSALAFTCIAAAVCVILLASPASPVVVPLIISGIAVGVGTGAGSIIADASKKKRRAAQNADILDASESACVDESALKGALIVDKTISVSIAEMLERAPQEVKQSPLFEKSASSAFNPVSQKDSARVLAAFGTLVANLPSGANSAPKA